MPIQQNVLRHYNWKLKLDGGWFNPRHPVPIFGHSTWEQRAKGGLTHLLYSSNILTYLVSLLPSRDGRRHREQRYGNFPRSEKRSVSAGLSLWERSSLHYSIILHIVPRQGLSLGRQRASCRFPRWVIYSCTHSAIQHRRYFASRFTSEAHEERM